MLSLIIQDLDGELLGIYNEVCMKTIMFEVTSEYQFSIASE